MKANLIRSAQSRLQAVTLALATATVAWGVSPESIQQGRQLFELNWSTRNPVVGSDGLGPLFNASSCVTCHHQSGVGGGGDSRFNAVAVGIESISFDGKVNSNSSNTAKLALIRNFFPGFIEDTGSVRVSAPLPHHGGTPEFESWRSFFRTSSQMLVSEEGGPTSADEVRVGLNSPIHFTGTNRGVTLVAKAQIFQRNSTSLFGAGLIDQIPGEVIARQAKIQQRHPEVSGRLSILPDGSIGRFGWRANATNLVRFVDRACANELGLETKRRPQIADPTRRDRRNSSIDISDEQIHSLSNFIAALPRPIQKPPASPDAAAELKLGREAFDLVGCALCHVSKMGQLEGLYSDLLLHDMGPYLYDFDAAEPYVISQQPAVEQRFVQTKTRVSSNYGSSASLTSTTFAIPNRFISPRSSQATSDFVTVSALGEVDSVPLRGKTKGLMRQEFGLDRKLKPSNVTQEWRTPPLWGVRDSAPYLHDGRADTLLQAIVLHDGEAEGTRDRFLKLPVAHRQALITFLESLVAPPHAPASKL